MSWVFFATYILAGLFIGSFLNVIIHRGPVLWKLVDGESRGNLIGPRSYCPSCREPIKRVHLIPLIGFLVLRGKCANCASTIPYRYPAIELLGALAVAIALAIFGPTISALFASMFFWFLIALAAVDLETGYLPDWLTIPLLTIGLVVNVAADIFTTMPNAIIGALAGYIAFRLIAAVFQKLRGAEGLGQGDAKLLAAFGAWLGWPALPPIVFLAAISALIGVLALNLSGRKISGDTPIPFGPALAFAGLFVMIARGLELPAYYWG